MSNMVEVAELSAWFGDLLAVDHASFQIGEGEFVALIGPSGCGKSTLLRAIAGIIPGMIPARLKGTINVLGGSPAEVKAGAVDMVFQEDCLLRWRSAERNVGLGLEVLGNNSPKVSPAKFLESIGLSGFENSLPRELSGGMRQRVALASSLITYPKLLLMDEPFANLDSLTRRRMWQLVVRLRDEGLIGTALLVTHNIEEAVVLSDKVVIMAGQPGRTVGEVPVDIPWPRISERGVLAPQCSHVIDTVTMGIWEAHDEAV